MNQIYNRLSGLYSHLQNRTFSSYWQARAPYVLKHLSVTAQDVVLEIGCGVGNWTSFLAPKARHYYALDIDLGSIKAAKLWKSYKQPVFPTSGVGFMQGVGESLSFRDDAINKLVAVDVIEHIPDDKAAVQEFARIVAPGGTALLTTLLEKRSSYIKRLEFSDHIREYTYDSFTALFENTDLEIQHVFYFYHTASTVARELQVATVDVKLIGTLLSQVVGLLGSPFIALENKHPFGSPGGIGIVAKKSLDMRN